MKNKIYLTIGKYISVGSMEERLNFKTWVGRTTIELVEKKTNSYTDDTLMQFGKYKGEKLIDVPASYLLWLYDNHKCYGELKDYIEENMDVLNNEIK